jgi:hypothetical protein
MEWAVFLCLGPWGGNSNVSKNSRVVIAGISFQRESLDAIDVGAKAANLSRSAFLSRAGAIYAQAIREAEDDE